MAEPTGHDVGCCRDGVSYNVLTNVMEGLPPTLAQVGARALMNDILTANNLHLVRRKTLNFKNQSLS